MDDLYEEARRQLTICNACRYCEGYCAVFPALERRRELSAGDIEHLANLCHDCRACLYACMYAPPHEFAINPPLVLSATRLKSYERHGLPLGPQRRLVLAVVLLFACAVAVLVLALATGAPRSAPSSSPYSVIGYGALVAAGVVPLGASLLLLMWSGAQYWGETRGRLGDLLDGRASVDALRAAASLRYLRGGGEGCYLVPMNSSPLRRLLHQCLVYGLLACLVSTIAAAVAQDLLGSEPPFALASVPVLFGLAGGAGIVLGSLGLMLAKSRSDPAATDRAMTGRDHALLAGILVIGVTGLLTTAFRSSGAYPVLLAVHLVAVFFGFAVLTGTKLVHGLYRLLALVQDSLEARHGGERV